MMKKFYLLIVQTVPLATPSAAKGLLARLGYSFTGFKNWIEGNHSLALHLFFVFFFIFMWRNGGHSRLTRILRRVIDTSINHMQYRQLRKQYRKTDDQTF